VKVLVYVEGGGDSKDLRIRCRKGFSKLFERAGLRGRMPGVVACGPRDRTFRSFCDSLKSRRQRFLPVLLVDSEAPVSGATGTAWDHLRKVDKWVKPPEAAADQAHLMVQVMESWFLADVAALRRYFGDGLRESTLPRRSDVESIAKKQVLSAIDRATRGTTKGAYKKGRHSFGMLELVDAATLEERSPYAKLLFDALRTNCG